MCSASSLPAALRVPLHQLKHSLSTHFGERLREVCLFGSQARGDAEDDSDVDVLIVIDDAWRAELESVIAICTDVSLQHDLLIEPRLFSTAVYAKHVQQERPLVMEIAREGLRV